MHQSLRDSVLSTMTAFSLPPKALTGQSNAGGSQKHVAKLIWRLAGERIAVSKILEVDSLRMRKSFDGTCLMAHTFVSRL